MGELEVIFSNGTLLCRTYEIIPRINGVPGATAHFHKSEFLTLGAVNYLDEVVINSVRQKSRIFTGYIVSIKNEPYNQVSVSLSGSVELTELGFKAFTVINIDYPERFYSMARIAGYSQNHLFVDQLNNAVKTMLAFVPFKGLVIEENEKVGEVEFHTLKSVQEKFFQIEKSKAWNGFLDADGWISFHFPSAHFADAELLATEKADVFLSAYSGLLQYGYSQFDGDFIEWERTRESINLKRQNHILLTTPHNAAVWVRDLTLNKLTQTTTKPTITLDIEAIMDASENFQLPLLIWNRFRDSEDYYVVTIGLSQVFELLAPEHKYPKRLKILNDRLKQYLVDIGLVLSEHDQELLGAFRKIRNDIEHGRKPEEPSLQEIKRVKALVNRVILASLKQAKTHES